MSQNTTENEHNAYQVEAEIEQLLPNIVKRIEDETRMTNNRIMHQISLSLPPNPLCLMPQRLEHMLCQAHFLHTTHVKSVFLKHIYVP